MLSEMEESKKELEGLRVTSKEQKESYETQLSEANRKTRRYQTATKVTSTTTAILFVVVVLLLL